MDTPNINIRIDREIKKQAEAIFLEIGLVMTTAIKMFLMATVRENRIPFSLKPEKHINLTREAIEEGKSIAKDQNINGYSDIDDLKNSLGV